MPERIQMSRQRPWRAEHPDAVIVSRPGKYGNPINLSDVGGQYPSLDDRQVSTLVVRDFEVLAKRGRLSFPNWRHLGGERGPVSWTYPSVEEIRAELGGHDLACWCPLDMPCHADVLLRIANPEPALCPECRDGKHGNCTGWTLDADDNETDCQCPCTAESDPTQDPKYWSDQS